MRLPFAVEELFIDWLQRHQPARASKILNRLREIRGGKLSAGDFDKRKQGEGLFAESIRSLFELSCKKYGLKQTMQKLSTRHFTRDAGRQMSLF